MWRYIDKNTALDWPGGDPGGVLAVRCLEGGAGSKATTFGDAHQPVVSWFVANGPDAKVNVIWTQVQPDVDLAGRGSPTPQMADNLNQTVADGATPHTTPVFTAKPLPTKVEIEAAHAAGKDLAVGENGAIHALFSDVQRRKGVRAASICRITLGCFGQFRRCSSG